MCWDLGSPSVPGGRGRDTSTTSKTAPVGARWHRCSNQNDSIAVSEQDRIEETTCPVAGIACKALTSQGATPDRFPSFSTPKPSVAESCSAAVCSILGSVSANHWGTCLILKMCSTPSPEQVFFPQWEPRQTPSSIARVFTWNFSWALNSVKVLLISYQQASFSG